MRCCRLLKALHGGWRSPWAGGATLGPWQAGWRSLSQQQLKEGDLNESHMLEHLSDLLFYTIAEGQESIHVHQFTRALEGTGLTTTDPRLRDCMALLNQTTMESSSGALLNKDVFHKCVQGNIVLLTQAFRRKFIIPDFEEFTAHVDRLYDKCRKLNNGKVANYIPQLAKFSPALWGVSLCTVDGQRHSIGDTRVPFCLQSCVKPLKYAISINDLGMDYIHRYVGKEPSGLKFNKMSLNEESKPHNPMVNAGAIVICSLMKYEINKQSTDRFRPCWAIISMA